MNKEVVMLDELNESVNKKMARHLPGTEMYFILVLAVMGVLNALHYLTDVEIPLFYRVQAPLIATFGIWFTVAIVALIFHLLMFSYPMARGLTDQLVGVRNISNKFDLKAYCAETEHMAFVHEVREPGALRYTIKFKSQVIHIQVFRRHVMVSMARDWRSAKLFSNKLFFSTALDSYIIRNCT